MNTQSIQNDLTASESVQGAKWELVGDRVSQEGQLRGSILLHSEESFREVRAARFGFRRISEFCRQKLTELKERLVNSLYAEFAGALSSESVRHVVNEADSLASLTPFPALFLPELALEKARIASAQNVRQRTIRYRTRAFVA